MIYRKGKDCLDYDICYQFLVTSDSQEPKSPKSGKTDLRKATNLVNLQDGKDEESLSLKTAIEKSETYDASSNSPKSLTILRNISLDVAPGQLVGIAGGVGSGKSTLILAILNEVIEWFINGCIFLLTKSKNLRTFYWIFTIDVNVL